MEEGGDVCSVRLPGWGRGAEMDMMLCVCVVLRGGRGRCECGHLGQWTRLRWGGGCQGPAYPSWARPSHPGPSLPLPPGSDPGGSVLPASRDLDTCQPTSYFILAPGM